MTVIIEELDDQDRLRTIARIDDGRIVDGEDVISGLLYDGADLSDDELLDRFDGPTLFARQVQTAEGSRASPLKGVDPIPSDRSRIDKEDLARWVAWVRSGRPDVAEARTFNPELHPRGPDGKFVERPWDIPDGMSATSIRKTPTLDLLDELNEAGEPIDEVLSSDVQIDGIPDDVTSVDEARERIGGDGVVFQDLEAGDAVQIGDGDDSVVGRIEKTEVVDGGPNIAHITGTAGTQYQKPVPDGTRIDRITGPVLPPGEAMGKDPMVPTNIQEGDRVAVATGYQHSNVQHQTTGIVESVGTHGGQQVITVDGEEYLPAHANAQVFDARPDPIPAADLEEGQAVKMYGDDGKLMDTGVVQGKSVIGGDLQYVDVDTGDGLIPAPADMEFYPDTTKSSGADDFDVDIQTPDDLDIDDIDPGDVGFDDLAPSAVPDNDLGVDEFHEDVSAGDWIAWREEGDDTDWQVAKVKESANASWDEHIVDSGDGDEPVGFNDHVRPVFDEDIVDAATDAVDQPSGTPADDIDPGSITTSDVSPQEAKPLDFTAVQDGDWIQYEDADGVHVGRVKQAGPSEHIVDTGGTTPEYVQDHTTGGTVWTFDDDYIADIGDPEGANTSNTQAADNPDSPFEADRVNANPNTDGVDEDDLSGPLSEGQGQAVGMLTDDQVQAFNAIAEDSDQADWDLFEEDDREDTSTRPGTSAAAYPQANPFKFRDHVAHFANQADGIPVDNGMEEVKDVLSNVDNWKGKSYEDWGQHLEKVFHGALDLSGDFRNDGLDGDPTTTAKSAVASVMTAATQEFLRRNWGRIDQLDSDHSEGFGVESDDGELPLYRGVGKNAVASLAQDWAEDPSADSITVTGSKLGNFSTDPGLATSWGEDSVVIKRNATPEEMVFSPDIMSNKITGIDDEGEIWLNGGVTDTPADNVQIQGNRTLADLPDDPADMDSHDLDVIAGWASSMTRGIEKHPEKKEAYLLQSEAQINTFERALERMEDENLPSYKRSSVVDIIDQSQDAVQSGPQPQPQTA